MSIEVERLSYVYAPGTPQARTALRDVSLTIADGVCAAIVGVTGSGKSTLVQHFNGLLRPTTGRIAVGNVAVTARLGGARLRKLRQRVGLLFQFPEAQLFAATVGADVAFGPHRHGLTGAALRERVRWALRSVALPADDAFLARSPFALSGGQRRRVALAGVLALRPATLVLDEPSAGLDAEARNELYACLTRLRSEDGLTLVIVSHDMSEVATLADTVFALADGELRLAGTSNVVFAQRDAILACGLQPPPLAETLSQARERGLMSGASAEEDGTLTPETLAGLLASALHTTPDILPFLARERVGG
ncbi:MAG: ATP-binding cassette domain-containing protein [Ktedonobacterales bacterium]